MRLRETLAFVAAGALLASASAHAQGAGSSLPRNETLIGENPKGRSAMPLVQHLRASTAGGQSTGLHQLAMDTFWYIDPNYGNDGVWYNSLAAEPPIYNDDFTEMTVRLRPASTGATGSPSPRTTWSSRPRRISAPTGWCAVRSSAQCRVHRGTGPAHRRLQAEAAELALPSLFTVRWNALDHAEACLRGADPLQFDFNPPVSIGAYTLHGYDPNGQWFTWEKREDWQRTTLAEFGEPGRATSLMSNPGPPDRRVIAQMNTSSTSPRRLARVHVHARQGLALLDRLVRRLSLRPSGPDPAEVIFNHQNRSSRTGTCAGRWRWPSDIKAVSMASYRGAATISAIAIPPTGTHTGLLPQPAAGLAGRLRARYRPAGDPPLRSDDRPADRRHAAALHGRPDPERSGADRGLVRVGWWTQDLQAAAELLERAGFTRRGNDWYMPNGERFSIGSWSRRMPVR
jgi:peptide/nickel transport system substrate-binding protein